MKTALAFLTILGLCFACGQRRASPSLFDRLIAEFSSQYRLIEGHNWELVNFYGFLDEDEAFFKVTRNEGDTTISIGLSKIFTEEGKSKEVNLTIEEYHKSYPIGDWIHVTYFTLQEDTLYHFKMSKENFEEIHFIVGEYVYKFETLALDSLQAKYFLAHRDSLSRIRGNNLPPLPKKYD